MPKCGKSIPEMWPIPKVPEGYDGDPRHYGAVPQRVDVLRIENGKVAEVPARGVMPYEVRDYVEHRCRDGNYEMATSDKFKVGNAWVA